MSQTFKFKLLSAVILIVLNLGLSSCQKSDKNDLKETQLCLNTADPSSALACLDKISSNNTAQAFKLRCAAMFISQGFTSPSSFTTALSSLTGSNSCGGSCSSTVAALNGLNFHSGDPKTVPADRTANDTAAALAFTYCSQSETDIYMQIASMFKIGTLATNAAYAASVAGATPTEAELLAAVATLPAATLGSIVNTTYTATCTDTTNASDEIKKYCSELQTSIAATNGTDAAVGACLQHILANPGATTCP